MAKSTSTEPYESYWIKCGDRHYKALCVPSRLPMFVPKYLNGGLIASALALFFYSRSDRPPYAVRVFWVKRTWWKWVWHRHLYEEYATMAEGKAKAREYEAALRAGHAPEGA